MKLAFIGTGKIIGDALFAVKNSKDIEITAIYAREHSKEKANKFALDYNIPYVYTSYPELLNNKEIDTVYIGLVNSAHFPYAKEALLNNKNVILEKPFTGFYNESLELYKIAQEKGLYIFEAISILHTPVFEKMQENLSKLGNIKMVLANYSQYSSRYDSYLKGKVEHAFDREYYGGALFDINIYNIHYCVALFGEPKDATYYPNKGFNGIDTSGTIILQYDDFIAVCSGAKDSDSECFFSIQGDKGQMRIPGKPNVAASLVTEYVNPDSTKTVRDAAGAEVREKINEGFSPETPHHRMTQEFEDFARVVKNKDRATHDKWLNQTLFVSKLLEKALNKAGIFFN